MVKSKVRPNLEKSNILGLFLLKENAQGCARAFSMILVIGKELRTTINNKVEPATA